MLVEGWEERSCDDRHVDEGLWLLLMEYSMVLPRVLTCLRCQCTLANQGKGHVRRLEYRTSATLDRGPSSQGHIL